MGCLGVGIGFLGEGARSWITHVFANRKENFLKCVSSFLVFFLSKKGPKGKRCERVRAIDRGH